MKKINKAERLNNVKYEIRGKVLDVAKELENKGINILKLNIGNPGAFNFNVPKKILNYMKKNLKFNQGYSDSKGLLKERISIKNYYKSKNVNINLDNIYIGNGVSELILITMQALLNKDDEILVPMPDYPLWTAAINLNSGKTVHYICDEDNNWYPNIEDIKKKITNKTKGIVIINPNNPTGSLYPKYILKEIINIAKKNNLIIFCDEIYDRLLYDNLKHISIASLSKEVPIITYSGLSKSHMAAGYRVGWMCISGNTNYLINYIEGLNLLTSMRLCSNVPAQSIITKALKDTKSTKKYFNKKGRLYKQRDYIYNRLKKIDGISVTKPNASFYIFPKIDIKKFNIKNDEEFILEFLKEKHILFVQGTGFNYNSPDHFRITYLAKIKDLKYALDSLENFLNKRRNML